MRNKEFYIGYLPKMPTGIAKTIIPFIGLVLALGIGLAVVFLTSQKPFIKSFFDFGNIQVFTGTIQARPIPFLLIEKGERNNGLPTFERIALVGETKYGADQLVKDFDGQRVTLKGTLIYQEDLRMIEVVQDSVKRSTGKTRKFDEKTESLGRQTLQGEIIDSKCYLGVMNPGKSKPHRDCAVNCLRGGIPALFVVKDARGNVSQLWLLSDKGMPINREILDYVAEPVELTGEVERKGDYLYLFSNPDSIKRLP